MLWGASELADLLVAWVPQGTCVVSAVQKSVHATKRGSGRTVISLAVFFLFCCYCFAGMGKRRKTWADGCVQFLKYLEDDRDIQKFQYVLDQFDMIDPWDTPPSLCGSVEQASSLSAGQPPLLLFNFVGCKMDCVALSYTDNAGERGTSVVYAWCVCIVSVRANLLV